MGFTSRLLLVVTLLAPVAAYAAGGHDSVGCAGCHNNLKPNTKFVNAKTNQPFTGSTAICLACHQEEKHGGQGYLPITTHFAHPYGLASINPKKAKVPAALLTDGSRFECMGCHDPHPSNVNYKYLRADSGKKGEKMDAFCGVCHSSKADPSTGKAVLFVSMDESRPPVVPAAAKK